VLKKDLAPRPDQGLNLQGQGQQDFILVLKKFFKTKAKDFILKIGPRSRTITLKVKAKELARTSNVSSRSPLDQGQGQELSLVNSNKGTSKKRA